MSVGITFFRRQLRILGRCRTLLLMLLPAVALVVLFSYVPMYGVVLAFKRFDVRLGIMGSPWVGFDNFDFFFRSGQWWPITRNTLLYNIAFLAVNTTMQLVFAMILSELASKWFRRIAQSGMLLPFFISWVVVGAMAFNLFQFERGFINNIIVAFGGERVDIYGEPSLWPFILIAFNAWKGVGYATVIYLAAITGLDMEMQEAAEIDGANIFQRMRHITLPCIAPTIIIMLLLSIGGIFRGDFGMFFNLIGLHNGRLFDATDIIDMYVVRNMFMTGGLERAAAAGFYQSIMGFITILFANWCVRKYDPDYALF